MGLLPLERLHLSMLQRLVEHLLMRGTMNLLHQLHLPLLPPLLVHL
jgi:hypothetical protein